MEFEVKKVYTVGGVTSNNDGTMTQYINISIGVVGCTYTDIFAERTVPYIFDENLSAKQAELNISTFASQWVTDNYPTIPSA